MGEPVEMAAMVTMVAVRAGEVAVAAAMAELGVDVMAVVRVAVVVDAGVVVAVVVAMASIECTYRTMKSAPTEE